MRAVRRSRNRTQAIAYLIESLVPRNADKSPAPLRPEASHRVKDSIGMIRPVDVSIDLRTEKALSERVVRVALNTHRPAMFDGDEHGARVGAVVRARAVDNASIGDGKGIGGHVTSAPDGAKLECIA